MFEFLTRTCAGVVVTHKLVSCRRCPALASLCVRPCKRFLLYFFAPWLALQERNEQEGKVAAIKSLQQWRLTDVELHNFINRWGST